MFLIRNISYRTIFRSIASGGLSVTERLLILCSKGNFDYAADTEKAILLIREGIDWDKFYDLATNGGVFVLVYNSLKHISQYIDIPADLMEELRNNYLVTNFKNSLLEGELKVVLREFNNAGIFCIPIKGIVLSYLLYKNATYRGPSLDIDVLVREEDRVAAEHKLKELGYQCVADKELEERRWQRAFKKNKIYLELHWDISRSNRTPKRIEAIFKDVVEYRIKDQTFPIFNPETLLVYLSVHLISSSGLCFLRYVADINQFFYVFKNRINWQALIEKGADCGARGSLYYTLILAHKLYGIDYPSGVIALLKPNFLNRVFFSFFISPTVTLRNTVRTKIVNRYLNALMLELTEARKARDFFLICKKTIRPLRIIRFLRALRNSRNTNRCPAKK